jgi:hypothetical protein
LAALIQERLNETVELQPGDRGEFTVWVDQQMVAKKGMLFFPNEKEAVESVQRALASAPPSP